jgi:hypothetical protein
VLRISIGNLRTEERHVKRAWELIRELGPQVDAELPAEPGVAL